MIEFGKSLRLAREAKGLTIAQIADTTRLAPKTVQELEDENFSHIVAPIYGRGFVKLYCEALGLDAKPFIDEFMAIYRGERDVGIREKAVTPPPEPAPEPAPEPMPEPVQPTAPEPPPASASAGLPVFDEPQAAQPASRYAAPVRREYAPTLSPTIWRVGILAAAAVLILWVAFLGVRALYRATSGAPAQTYETPSPDTVEETPAAAETPAPASPAETPSAEVPKAPEPRAPQSIPSIYLD